MPSKQRVLVVDDDRLVADTLSLVFRANGFESEARYSVADALERARTFTPRLVLCDITMPEADGFTLVEAITQEMPDCHVLLLTAYSSNARMVEQRATELARPLRLLNKPCRPELLLHEAHALLATA